MELNENLKKIRDHAFFNITISKTNTDDQKLIIDVHKPNKLNKTIDLFNGYKVLCLYTDTQNIEIEDKTEDEDSHIIIRIGGHLFKSLHFNNNILESKIQWQ